MDSLSLRTSAMLSFSARQRAFSALACSRIFGQLALHHGEPLLGVRVALFLQRLALDLQVGGAALQLVDLGRHRVDLNAQRSRRLVDQVNRLVGQKAVADVAMRKHAAETIAESLMRTPW